MGNARTSTHITWRTIARTAARIFRTPLADLSMDQKNLDQGAGLPVSIEVGAKYPPSEEATKFYRLAGKIVAEVGCSLELVLPSSGTKTRF